MRSSRILTAYVLLPNWSRTIIFLCFYIFISSICHYPIECKYECLDFFLLKVKPIGSIIVYEPIQLHKKIPFYMAGAYELVIAQKDKEIVYHQAINTNHFIMMCLALFVVFAVYSTK